MGAAVLPCMLGVGEQGVWRLSPSICCFLNGLCLIRDRVGQALGVAQPMGIVTAEQHSKRFRHFFFFFIRES